jgi:transposase
MTRLMRPSISLPAIYLHCAPVDFRKASLGLSAIVELELGRNPFDGKLYVFINRHRNKIKCLFWEKNGFVLYYKSLAEEKFKWPKAGDTMVTVTGEQMNWLLDGYDITQMQGHRELHYDSVF